MPDADSLMHLQEGDTPLTDMEYYSPESVDDAEESADPGHEDTPTTSETDTTSFDDAEAQAVREFQTDSSEVIQQPRDRPTDRDRYLHQSEKIIDKAREYQQELFERAIDDNIIAVLDTGMGKTLIAAMLIRHTLEQDLVKTTDRASQRRIFFLANRSVDFCSSRNKPADFLLQCSPCQSAEACFGIQSRCTGDFSYWRWEKRSLATKQLAGNPGPERGHRLHPSCSPQRPISSLCANRRDQLADLR